MNHLFIREKATKLERLVNRTALQELQDQKALVVLSRYMQEYLPWTGSALRPSAVCVIFNEVIIHKKLRILEIGCGMSTVMLSRFLAERGGSMVTIENNKEWIEITKSNLSEGAKACHFIQADLCDVDISGRRYKWYDLASDTIANQLQEQKFDILIVDAPIGSFDKNIRYPALPQLKKYLADDFVIFLDDIERQDETEVAAQWCEENDLMYQKSPIIGGLGIMRPKNTSCHFNIF